MNRLNHFDERGHAVMTDVGGKYASERRAVACGRIVMPRRAYDAVKSGGAPKGDVLGVARVAGIMAVKKTPEWIPLCHPLPVSRASVDFNWLDESCALEARCTVSCFARTGVEMEALTGVTAALLSVYDMAKALSKEIRIEGVCLKEKTGGKSGAYRLGDRL